MRGNRTPIRLRTLCGLEGPLTFLEERKMKMGKWLTDSIVRDLKLPEHGVKRVYDAPDPRGKMGWTSGFGVRVSSGGSKSFVLLYRSRKTRTEHLFTIGSFPDWSVAAAR